MPAASSLVEQRFAIPIWLVGVDVVPLKQYFHHSLMPILSSTIERCLASVVWIIAITSPHFTSPSLPIIPFLFYSPPLTRHHSPWHDSPRHDMTCISESTELPLLARSWSPTRHCYSSRTRSGFAKGVFRSSFSPLHLQPHYDPTLIRLR